jgi:hypothetical protein
VLIASRLLGSGGSLVELKNLLFVRRKWGGGETTGTKERLRCCGLVPGFGLNWCFSVGYDFASRDRRGHPIVTLGKYRENG